MTKQQYVDGLIECNNKLTRLNSKLINQSEAMMRGVAEVVSLIENDESSSRAQYEEVLAKIMKTLELTLTRANNYVRNYDTENR